MKTPLTTEQLEALRRLDASTLANAIESFQHRLRNEGFTDGSVRCLFPHLPHVAGYAVTVKIRGSAPPFAGDAYLERTDWWDYVVSMPAPRMVVVQDVATQTGTRFIARCGALQHLACAWLRRRGDQRRGAGHTGGRRAWLPTFHRRHVGIPRLCSHCRIRHASGDRWT